MTARKHRSILCFTGVVSRSCWIKARHQICTFPVGKTCAFTAAAEGGHNQFQYVAILFITDDVIDVIVRLLKIKQAPKNIREMRSACEKQGFLRVGSSVA